MGSELEVTRTWYDVGVRFSGFFVEAAFRDHLQDPIRKQRGDILARRQTFPDLGGTHALPRPRSRVQVDQRPARLESKWAPILGGERGSGLRRSRHHDRWCQGDDLLPVTPTIEVEGLIASDQQAELAAAA